MSTNIDDLRQRLFEAIDAVVSGKISVEQARQISDLSQVIVNSAKVEVDYLRTTNGAASEFLEPGKKKRLPNLSPDPVNGALRRALGMQK